MWAGPHNPAGSYAFPSMYGDGTTVYSDDFSADQWPDSSDWLTRWIFGELDYHKMVPPSMSCMAAKLPSNNKVRAFNLAFFSKLINRPVVCKGENE